MALQRKNPLPPGRYWIDVQRANLAAFDTWAKNNAETVIIDRTESTEQDARVPASSTNPTILRWVLFTVLQPTLFLPNVFGAPTIATPEVQTKADTVQRPPEPTPASVLDDFFKQFSTPTTLLIIVGVAYVLGRSGDK